MSYIRRSLIISVFCCLNIHFSAGKTLPAETLRLWPERTPAESLKMEADPRHVGRVTNVSDPKLYLYPADGDGIRPAVMVCPGGGYRLLAMDLEGTEVAQWLNSIGFTAILLEYTVPQDRNASLQDAQRAMGLIRQNSKAWEIDPERLGVLGFSAGGHLCARLSNSWSGRTYAPVDTADSQSCRPDFTVLVYPAYLGNETGHLVPEIQVSARTPPAFIVQTLDDERHVDSSIAYLLALKAAGVPVELHLYPYGGHGYGLRSSSQAVSNWPALCTEWLNRQVCP